MPKKKLEDTQLFFNFENSSSHSVKKETREFKDNVIPFKTFYNLCQPLKREQRAKDIVKNFLLDEAARLTW